jgi:hypothetical protein
MFASVFKSELCVLKAPKFILGLGPEMSLTGPVFNTFKAYILWKAVIFSNNESK